MDFSPWYRKAAFRNALKLLIPAAIDLLILRQVPARTALNSTIGDIIVMIGSFILILLAIFSWRISQRKEQISNAGYGGVRTLILALWALAPLIFIFQSDQFTWQSALFAQLGLGLTAFLLTILLLSQFVLPVLEAGQGSAAFRRLLGRALGEHGPITSIRYGQVVEAHDERQRKDPGVILIDNASAAVLRTNTQFTRAVGPGLVFTQEGERIAEAIDLRLQTRSIRGQSDLGRQEQPLGATSSLALTEDGIPVSANLKVTFLLHPGHQAPLRLGSKPELPPYEFNPTAAEGAVIRHTYTRDQDVPWTEIPIRLVVDLWREFIKGWRLEDLLGDGKTGPPTHSLEPPLVQLQNAIFERLRLPQPEESPSNQLQGQSVSPEYEVLSALGIRIVSISITGLRVPEDVKAERLRLWRAGWADGLQRNLRQSNQAVEKAEQLGQRTAYQFVAQKMTRRLRNVLSKGEQPGMRDSLRLILQDAAEMALSDDQLDDGPTLAHKIESILNVLDNLDTGCQGPPA